MRSWIHHRNISRELWGIQKFRFSSNKRKLKIRTWEGKEAEEEDTTVAGSVKALASTVSLRGRKSEGEDRWDRCAGSSHAWQFEGKVKLMEDGECWDYRKVSRKECGHRVWRVIGRCRKLRLKVTRHASILDRGRASVTVESRLSCSKCWHFRENQEEERVFKTIYHYAQLAIINL